LSLGDDNNDSYGSGRNDRQESSYGSSRRDNDY
jgi:hypothetical protein